MVARFNTQPPEGGWRNIGIGGNAGRGFNTQPPEGGWFVKNFFWPLEEMFQHTAARRRLGRYEINTEEEFEVSTHSRPKAAGLLDNLIPTGGGSFNTQPPEGGWANQHQARYRQ